jgi:hypothetical protein
MAKRSVRRIQLNRVVPVSVSKSDLLLLGLYWTLSQQIFRLSAGQMAT